MTLASRSGAAKMFKLETIRSINETIGFWRRMLPIEGTLGTEVVEYRWFCGCEALADSGMVLQWVKCIKHGGEDYDISDD